MVNGQWFMVNGFAYGRGRLAILGVIPSLIRRGKLPVQPNGYVRLCHFVFSMQATCDDHDPVQLSLVLLLQLMIGPWITVTTAPPIPVQFSAIGFNCQYYIPA